MKNASTMSMNEPCSAIWNNLKNNKVIGLDCLVNMVPKKLICNKKDMLKPDFHEANHFEPKIDKEHIKSLIHHQIV